MIRTKEKGELRVHLSTNCKYGVALVGTEKKP